MVTVSKKVPFLLFVSVVLAGQVSCGKIPANIGTQLTNPKSADEHSAQGGGTANLQIADLAKIGDVKQLKITLRSADSQSGSYSYSQTDAYARDKTMAIANLPRHVYTLTIEVLDGAGKVLAIGVAQNIQITPNATINVCVATSDTGSSAGLEVKVVAPVTDTGAGKKTDPVMTQEEKAQSLISIQNALAQRSKALTQFETEKARISQCGPRPQQPLEWLPSYCSYPGSTGTGPGMALFGVVGCDHTEPAEMVRQRESFTSWVACVKKDSVITPEGEGESYRDYIARDYIANGLRGFDPARFIEGTVANIQKQIWHLERMMARLQNSAP